MNIAFASDHIGFPLKTGLIAYVTDKGHTVTDFGTDSTQRAHFPLYAFRAAQAVARGECDLGILICGTGIGVSIVANKVRGIRAVACSDVYSARMARMHNNANMLAFGARVVSEDLAQTLCDAFLEAAYEGGRHQQRIDMITQIEERGTL